MKLVNVHKHREAETILYALLKERSSEEDRFVNIRHRELPPWKQHVRFVRSRPYRAWYLVFVEGECVGYVSLTRADEIGIILFRAHRGKGHGPKAVQALMKKHPRPSYIANINPNNERSIRMFAKLGYAPLLNSYEFHA